MTVPHDLEIVHQVYCYPDERQHRHQILANGGLVVLTEGADRIAVQTTAPRGTGNGSASRPRRACCATAVPALEVCPLLADVSRQPRDAGGRELVPVQVWHRHPHRAMQVSLK